MFLLSNNLNHRFARIQQIGMPLKVFNCLTVSIPGQCLQKQPNIHNRKFSKNMAVQSLTTGPLYHTLSSALPSHSLSGKRVTSKAAQQPTNLNERKFSKNTAVQSLTTDPLYHTPSSALPSHSLSGKRVSSKAAQQPTNLLDRKFSKTRGSSIIDH